MNHPTAPAMLIRYIVGKLCAMAVACVVSTYCSPALAQGSAGCEDGHRVIAHRWDAVLKTNWEMRQDCVHPEWPTRLVAVHSPAAGQATANRLVIPNEQAPATQPLLVRAGDQVLLWMEDGPVRIQMSGEAEQSARNGEHIVVRITRQSDDDGLTVQRITGIVRSVGSVEMER